MASRKKHPETYRRARKFVAATGESPAEAVGMPRGPRLRDELRAIRMRCASYAAFDRRSSDEILGYDEHGLPR
jgi:antitoxin VapB